MDRSRLSDLAHARHPIAAPLADASVDRLLALLVVGGSSVLDLGCGDGSWLLRALRLDPGVTAVGVDLSGHGFDRVRRQVEREAMLRSRFTSAHPQVRTAVVPALAGDVHDLDGLRAIGELLTDGAR